MMQHVRKVVKWDLSQPRPLRTSCVEQEFCKSVLSVAEFVASHRDTQTLQAVTH